MTHTYLAALALTPLLVALLGILWLSRRPSSPVEPVEPTANYWMTGPQVAEVLKVLGAHLETELAAAEERLRDELELAIADVDRRMTTSHSRALRELTNQANRRPTP